MQYVCRGARELNAAFDRGASCALWFEEGTTITDRESFVDKMNEAKTCGVGRTGNTLQLSQVKGIVGNRYYPTQMVDGPQLSPGLSISSQTGPGLGYFKGQDGAGGTRLNIFRAFLCSQVQKETVTAFSAGDIDGQLGYGMTDRVHEPVGKNYVLSLARKIFLGNYAGALNIYTGDSRQFTNTTSWSDWSYFFGWDCCDLSTRNMGIRGGVMSSWTNQFSLGQFNQVLLVQHRSYEYYLRYLTGYPTDIRHVIYYNTVGVCNSPAASKNHPFVTTSGELATPTNTQLKFGMFGVRGYDYEFLCRISADEIEQPATYTPGTMPTLQSKIDLPKYQDKYLC